MMATWHQIENSNRELQAVRKLWSWQVREFKFKNLLKEVNSGFEMVELTWVGKDYTLSGGANERKWKK